MIPRSARRVWILALSALLLPAAASAQEVQGLALDPQGEPLSDVVVALHRVGDAGPGANVASVTTDEDGRFRFQIEVPDSALYFAAMRYDDRMYIGPPAMAGIERVTDYLLVADPAAEAGAVAAALSGGGMDGVLPGGAAGQAPPPGPGGEVGGQGSGQAALLIVGLLSLTAAALFIITAPRYRRRRTREALVEVATVENRLAEDPAAHERAELVRRRDQLRERLAPHS